MLFPRDRLIFQSPILGFISCPKISEKSKLSNELIEQGKSFADFLQGMNEDDRQKGSEHEFLRAKEEHARFRGSYQKGMCYLCHKPLSSFSKKKPCIHWLLKPKGFKKKDVKLIAKKYGVFQIQSLLRWYANEEGFAKNINDLAVEGTGTKIIELTIKYKNIEWSFSCAETDFIGHKNSQNADFPHYHFQMRIDKRAFINFNNFHLPLSDMDVIHMLAKMENPDFIRQRHSFGEGMSDMFSEGVIEEVLNTAVTDGDAEKSPIKLDTFVYAEEGKKINGDDLYSLMEEAKEKGVTVASLIHKLPNAKTEVMVSPGPGVVEQAPRSRGKKGT